MEKEHLKGGSREEFGLCSREYCKTAILHVQDVVYVPKEREQRCQPKKIEIRETANSASQSSKRS